MVWFRRSLQENQLFILVDHYNYIEVLICSLVLQYLVKVCNWRRKLPLRSSCKTLCPNMEWRHNIMQPTLTEVAAGIDLVKLNKCQCRHQLLHSCKIHLKFTESHLNSQTSCPYCFRPWPSFFQVIAYISISCIQPLLRNVYFFYIKMMVKVHAKVFFFFVFIYWKDNFCFLVCFYTNSSVYG